ncbi:MAG: DUF4340 domain-containing protein [Gammaproteobacteria bacterium]|nr:DUF4340 domain-containing protein [Gammaproteobacteria bacterium]
MRAKTFTWVLLLSAALAGAAWYYLGRDAAPPDLQGRLLFPDLRAVLTGARAIEITTADESFTLESLEAGGWAVRERHGYPAQTATVRRFLLGVAGLQIRSRKTSNPDNYARLDLTAPEDDSGSKAARVVIRDEDGGEMAAFLAGRIRPASEVENPDPDRGESGLKDLSQIFVRLPDAPTVWLVEGALDIARQPTDYINRDRLTDTPRNAIRSVTVARPSAADLSVTRAAQGEDFELQNIAAGMQLKNQFQLNDLVDLFVNLKFEDVTSADEIAWAGDGDGNSGDGGDGAGAGAGLTATMFAFDKSRVVMEQGEDAEGKPWIRLRAEPPPPAANSTDGENAAADSAEDGDAAESAAPAPDTSRADELNQRWSGWAFQLPDFRHDTLNRGMDELVEAEDEADGDGDDESGG